MKSVIAVLLFFVASSLNAKEVSLADITSNYKKEESYTLLLDVDDVSGQIVKIKTRSNPKNKIKEYGPEVFANELPLVKAAGIVLVGLRCSNFNPATGCDIVISYPYNIAIINFDKFSAQLKQVGGEWGLYANDKKFTQMHLVANRMLGILVGVDRIELN